MRGFTARTNDSSTPVRIQFPDNADPRVMVNGRTLAQGVPEVVPRDTDDGRLVCFSSVQWEGRTARRIVRDIDTHGEDVPVARTSTIFAAEGFPPLWGARLDERQNRVMGWTFVDGVATLETWEVEMDAQPRRCCGKTAPPPAPSFVLPALAWEVE